VQCAQSHKLRRSLLQFATGSTKALVISLSATKRLIDPLQHIINVDENLSIPKPNHAVAAPLEQLRTPRIFRCLVKVLSAVEFDHELRVRACKVSDEVSDRELPPEAELAESFGSETGPQLLFRVSLIAAQPAGMMVWKKDGFHILFASLDYEVIRTVGQVL
jgi:hypothetical protein